MFFSRRRFPCFSSGQFYIQCRNDEEKYDAVKMIYSTITIGQAMIFCRSKRTAHNLALKMIKDKHCVELLSSELTVEQRAAVIKRFREGKFRVLVVTNVCARGIDIDDISLVVNFEFPLIYDERQHNFVSKPDYDTYLHRIGRAGRFGRTGHTYVKSSTDRRQRKNELFSLDLIWSRRQKCR